MFVSGEDILLLNSFVRIYGNGGYFKTLCLIVSFGLCICCFGALNYIMISNFDLDVALRYFLEYIGTLIVSIICIFVLSFSYKIKFLGARDWFSIYIHCGGN